MITVCNSFPVKLRCRTPCMTLALEQEQYQNMELGGPGSQTGNAGMLVPDNKKAKRRMVGILLPAVDLVGSLSWNSWAVWWSPRGLARMAGCVVGVCPVSVSPGRGSEWAVDCVITLHFWPPRAPAVSVAASDSRRGIGGLLDPCLRFMPRLIPRLVAGDSVWHRASTSKVDYWRGFKG